MSGTIREEHGMKTILASIAAMVLMASAASAQTEQNAPGTGGTSKPGIQGCRVENQAWR
jgi:hypothetical protein